MPDAPTLDDLLPKRRAPAGASQIPNENAPTLDDLMAGMKKPAGTVAAQPAESTPVTDDDFKGSTLQFGPLDTHIPIPASVGRGLAQIGSGLADLPLRGRQLVGAANTQDVDEKRALDARLNTGVSGFINSAAGQALPFAAAPEIAMPRAMGVAAPIVKNALMGALQGYAQPVGTGDSTARNIATGGVAGTVLPAVIGTAMGAATKATPYIKNLAQMAIDQYGIPLGAADVSQNKFVKAFGSLMNDTGFNAGRLADKKDAYQTAIANTFGENTPDLGAATFARARTRIGNDLDTVWNNNSMPYTQDLDNKLNAIQAEADRYPGNTATTVQAHIADIRSRMQPNPTTGQAEIPGDIVNNYQSNLRANHENLTNPQLDNRMMDIRRALIDNFNANVSPDDAALLTQARTQYKALKTVEPAITKAENAVAGRLPGDVSPTDLAAAVTKNYGMNTNPFGDLPEIGQLFLKDNAAQTGGSARAAIQNLGLVGLGSSGLASGLGEGLTTGIIPASLGVSGSTALGGYLLNKAAQSPGLYNMMAEIGGKPTPGITNAVKQLVKNQALRLPSAAALGLLEAGVARQGDVDSQSVPEDGTESPVPSQGALSQTAPAISPTQ